MRKIIFLFLFLFQITFAQSQELEKPDFNFGFEKRSGDSPLPDGWFRYTPAYRMGVDSSEKHSGKYSLFIEFDASLQAAKLGGVSNAIDADYEGREIELKAFLKLKDVKNGVASLFLRLQNESRELVYSGDLSDQTIQGSKDWTVYTLKTKYPKGVKKIILGAWLTGEGKMWVDDVQLLIDGREIGNREIVYKGKEDKEFDKGSSVTSIELNSSKTDDLVLLGKIWGFLKYYHPAVRDGNYNWDYELFRILPKILAAQNPSERDQVLITWITGLGTFEKGKEQNLNDKDHKLKPDLDWITQSGLDNALVKQLSAVKNATRTEVNCYIGTEQVGNPLFKNEAAYPVMREDDAGMRLLSLYRYWNSIQYYFPYKNLIDENWNEVLKMFIPRFIEATNELEYKKTVLLLVAHIHDSHSGIFNRDSVIAKYYGLNGVPVNIKFIDNKAVVSTYVDPVKGPETGLKPGDVIEKINDRSVDEILKENLPYIPGSNTTAQMRYYAHFLLRTNNPNLAINYIRDGQTTKTEVNVMPIAEVRKILQHTQKDTCFKMLQPDIAYLFPGSLTNDYVNELMPRIQRTKGLVIDLRCYPREFVVYNLCNYLYPKRKAFATFTFCSMLTPGLFTFMPDAMAGTKNAQAYKGKLVILVNEETISQSEFTTMALRIVPGSVVMGSTTLGADGDVSDIVLPGDMHTWISGIGVYNADRSETQRIGIVPDIVIKPTIKDIKEGKDVVLEKAIDILNRK